MSDGLIVTGVATGCAADEQQVKGEKNSHKIKLTHNVHINCNHLNVFAMI